MRVSNNRFTGNLIEGNSRPAALGVAPMARRQLPQPPAIRPLRAAGIRRPGLIASLALVAPTVFFACSGEEVPPEIMVAKAVEGLSHADVAFQMKSAERLFDVATRYFQIRENACLGEWWSGREAVGLAFEQAKPRLFQGYPQMPLHVANSVGLTLNFIAAPSDFASFLALARTDSISGRNLALSTFGRFGCLGRTAWNEMLPLLQEGLQSSEREVVRSACSGFSDLAEAAKASKDEALLDQLGLYRTDLLNALRLSSEDENVIPSSARKALDALPVQDKDIGLFVQALSGEISASRSFLFYVLRSLPSYGSAAEAATSGLLKTLRTEESDLYHAAARAVGGLAKGAVEKGDWELLHKLRPARDFLRYAQPEPTLKQGCGGCHVYRATGDNRDASMVETLRLLSSQNLEDDISWIVQLLKSEEAGDLRTGLSLMANANNQARPHMDLIVKALSHSSPEVRKEAARTLYALARWARDWNQEDFLDELRALRPKILLAGSPPPSADLKPEEFMAHTLDLIER